MKWPLIRALPHHFSFDFVKLAPFAAVLSALLIAGTAVAYFTLGLNMGPDFAGGTLMKVTTQGPAPLGQLRQFIEGSDVQEYGAPNVAAIRFKPKGDPTASDAAVRARLEAKFPGLHVTDTQSVSAKVSKELFIKGFEALGIAMLLMLLYIWFRFQLQFGLGAIVAIFHDVILTLGLLMICHLEFKMETIAALLTVIGYSMNEKVITFDRLRENLRKYKKTPLRDVINLSENERLSRTIITGTTALLALSGMLFLGGPALFPLIMTMVFGIIVGTYSSIYVALPVILLWGVKKNDDEAVPLKPAGAR
jgi:preprotein translocase subunit SecF